MIYSLVRHKKTGNLYLVLDQDLINATNAQDGQKMVRYRRTHPLDPEGLTYVRELSEFAEKFEPYNGRD